MLYIKFKRREMSKSGTMPFIAVVINITFHVTAITQREARDKPKINVPMFN